MKFNNEQIKYDFEQVLITMLWSTSDTSNDDCMLDENYSLDDVDENAMNDLWVLYHEFIHNTSNLIEGADLDYYQVAHDFWLTCNGHGTGFWDRGLGEVGDKLTEHCKIIGSIDPFVLDDKIYI